MALITKPGVYFDVPIEDYHGAEICPAPSISPTGIKRILDCPARYWHDSPLNPNRETDETDALRFGAAIHLLLSDHAAFSENVRTFPDFRGRRALEADKARAAGHIVLRESEEDLIWRMLDGIKANPLAALAFGGPGHVEPTLAWQDEETGVWLRCRPDWLPKARLIVPDYKSTASAHPREFTNACARYGYHIQAAMIFEGIRAVYGEAPESFVFVAQEKKPPFITSTFAMDPAWIAWGAVQMRKGVRLFADCLSANKWPAYTDDEPETINAPAWFLADMDAQVHAGELELRADAPDFDKDFSE